MKDDWVRDNQAPPRWLLEAVGVHQKVPKGEGRDILNHLKQIGLSKNNSLLPFFERRIAFGQEKYGERLHSQNGRDALIDVIQELTDAIVYLHQHEMEIEEGFSAGDLDLTRYFQSVLMGLFSGILAYTSVHSPNREDESNGTA